MKWAYYNEIDPFCAQWLRNLMREGLIMEGEVDERSIQDVAAADVDGYIQCHFFAGIGGWAYALQLAGWDDATPVWTGSCPCQPFSVANVAHGGAKGQEDDRHLLPDLLRLVCEHMPSTIFGEQVAQAIKWGWVDEAFGYLEDLDYACGSAIVPALAVGTRHERKRIYWVADSGSKGRQGHQPVECISVSAAPAFTINGDSLVDARRALDGDYGHLLHCDGLSVQLERDAVRGFGNAIVPQAAAEFIVAYMEI